MLEYTGVGTVKMSTFESAIKYTSLDTLKPKSAVDSEETQLIRRCQNGDHNAFNELFVRYRSQVYQLAYRFSRNSADAEDILQNTFIRAFKYIHRFDLKYPFYPWLRTIVTNESQTYLGKRSKRRYEPLETMETEERDLIESIPDTHMVPADKKVEGTEIRNEIHQAVSKLPEQQRICFTLFEIENMKVREVADMLGCTEGTVKTHLHRARYTLRNLLKDKLKDYKGW